MFEGISLWAGALFGGITQYRDTRNLNQGEMDRKEYAVETTENVTGALGVWAGVEYGSMLGTTLIPGVGTAVGAVLGGMLGARVGSTVGHEAGNAVFIQRSSTIQRKTNPVIGETKLTARKMAVKATEMALDLTEKAKEAAAGMKRQLQSVVEEARNQQPSS
jgi:outer membrane lipoprotein SlyB